MGDPRAQINVIDSPLKAQETDYFDQVHSAFEKAAQSTGGKVDRSIQFGEFIIRLSFAGPALESRILPAFDHLSTGSVLTPSLTINLWDSASTSINLPRPPWIVGDYLPRGDIWSGESDQMVTLYEPANNTLCLLDRSRNEAVFWIKDASKVPYYESGAPLRMVLHWWMSGHGYQLVHAGAVGTPHGGVLLTGKGGSGKSTTALACIGSELGYAGDDYCMISNSPAPCAHSIFNSGKLNAEDAYRFPKLRSALSNADRLATEKALFFIYQVFPETVVREFPIRAIFIPRVAGSSETHLKPVSPVEGFLAMAPSTIFQLRGVRKTIHKSIGEITRKVPSYVLELGTDIEEIPGVISDWLSRN